jgi:hypothetical protein
MGHVVIAGYVTVETAVPGGRAQIDIPRGTPLPTDVPPEQRNRLLALGDIAEVTVEKVSAEPAPPVAVPGPADGTIAEVMERVGGDPEKALAAWQAEEAKGEKARSTLMRDLAAIVEAQ